jgi:hypothetical protein
VWLKIAPVPSCKALQWLALNNSLRHNKERRCKVHKDFMASVVDGIPSATPALKGSAMELPRLTLSN